MKITELWQRFMRWLRGVPAEEKIEELEEFNKRKNQQVIIYSNPKLFEPRLVEADSQFEWLKDLLTGSVGRERGDMVVVIVRREIGKVKIVKSEAMVSEYLASQVFRWDGKQWEGIFGTGGEQFQQLRQEIQHFENQPEE